VKVDLSAPADEQRDPRPLTRRAEANGYDGVWLSEVKHDPFLGLALAATVSERVDLGSSIAVAFSRNPMSTAVLANDLHALSGGRLLLGLGTQVKAHVARRFSMPWSRPTARIREYVLAMRAIWTAWETGERLDFAGEFYTHTLMTPMFVPESHGFGRPAVLLAAVGPAMTEVAGEVADGLLPHGFTTERYLRTVTLPALDRGRERAGRRDQPTMICGAPMIVTGSTDKQREQAAAAVRSQIAFYGSTPSYAPVLELHGWGDLAAELHVLSRAGEWDQMSALVTTEVLDAFAIVADPPAVAEQVRRRFGDIFHRITLVLPYELDDDVRSLIAAGLRA
jgi:probable F420-dependent oxidoreductase